MTVEFVQIGREAFNVASINYIDFSFREMSVRIDYTSSSGDGVKFLRGPAASAFKEWWESKANVYYIDPTWFDEDHAKSWEDTEDRGV